MVKVNSNSIKEKKIDVPKIWDKLAGFASYSFNKSHAISYSLLSFQTAKVYTYHWIEFMEYQINSGGADKAEQARKELKAAGFINDFPTFRNMKGNDVRIQELGKSREYMDNPGVLTNERREGDYLYHKIETRNLSMEEPEIIPRKPGQFTDTYIYPMLSKIERKERIDGYGNRNIKSHVGKIILPGGEKYEYDNIIEALFSDTATNTSILKGCFNELTYDREGLLNLVNSLPNKSRLKILDVPYEVTTLIELLDAMQVADIITKYETEPIRGSKRKLITVYVKAARGADKVIKIGNVDFEYNQKLDHKYFKDTRAKLNAYPVLFETGYDKLDESIRKALNKKFAKMISENPDLSRMDPVDETSEAFIKFKNNKSTQFPLRKVVQEMTSIIPKTAGINCKVTISSVWSTQYKGYVELAFSDKMMTYPIHKEWANELKKLPKGSVIIAKLRYSPFIKASIFEYVEDFDLIEIKTAEGSLSDQNQEVYGVDSNEQPLIRPNKHITKKKTIFVNKYSREITRDEFEAMYLK